MQKNPAKSTSKSLFLTVSSDSHGLHENKGFSIQLVHWFTGWLLGSASFGVFFGGVHI